jgi:hypothetical protein
MYDLQNPEWGRPCTPADSSRLDRSAFAQDTASRGRDPRPSLAERYGATPREGLLDAAADALRHDRLLLVEDHP